MATEPNIEQVRILNSEINTHYYIYVRSDRLQEFIQFVRDNRKPDVVASLMPGLSWSATLGLDAIFALRPKKFPTQDIINWLREQVIDGIVSPAEIENALERFSLTHPPDVGAKDA